MSEDGNELNDWLAHFMRDRYFAVCEERNAYQQMQSELTAVLDTISRQTKAVEIDKDIVEKQLQDALLAKQEALNVLQSMLTIVGVRCCRSFLFLKLVLILFCSLCIFTCRLRKRRCQSYTT